MVDNLTEKWIKYTQINNSSSEIIDIGKVKVLVVKDIFKYPDQLRSLIDELKFDSCLNTHIGSPGKKYTFNPSLNYLYARPITNIISEIFGCMGVYSKLIYINCFNGNMLSHYNYPHIDSDGRNPNVSIVGNIGLTKNMKGGTGFWSYRGKLNAIDMTLSEFNCYENFIKDQNKTSDLIIDKITNLLYTSKSNSIMEDNNLDDFCRWRQIENEGDWKLEGIAPLEYNSFVMYSSLNFHNPYIKEDWYINNDRISISTFFDVEPNSLNYNSANKSSISNLWKIFKLDTIHNINFD